MIILNDCGKVNTWRENKLKPLRSAGGFSHYTLYFSFGDKGIVLAPYQVGQRLQLKTVIFRHEEAHMDPGREAEIVAEAKSSG